MPKFWADNYDLYILVFVVFYVVWVCNCFAVGSLWCRCSWAGSFIEPPYIENQGGYYYHNGFQNFGNADEHYGVYHAGGEVNYTRDFKFVKPFCVLAVIEHEYRAEQQPIKPNTIPREIYDYGADSTEEYKQEKR